VVLSVELKEVADSDAGDGVGAEQLAVSVESVCLPAARAAGVDRRGISVAALLVVNLLPEFNIGTPGQWSRS
jgi:hypothetical protein